ncbi:hypothetical protein F-liban_464 [Faustovirus]|nr:hypothetical protein F-liban_464 [Faustovirus]
MDSLPNELIIDTIFIIPRNYCSMVAVSRRFARLLLPLRERFADLCVTMWHMENHVYGTLGASVDSPKHTRETLYDGRVSTGKKYYEIDWRYGLKHGVELWYGCNGVVNSVLHWHNGIKCGQEILYYSTGDILLSREWKDNKLVGMETMYSNTGDVTWEYDHTNGIQIEK